MDRRLTPANGRAALSHLRGQVEAAVFTDGTAARVGVPLADLLKAPGGARDRQLLLGDGVLVIDRHQGFAFVQAEKDGYCGYVAEAALDSDGPAPTHWVCAPGSHLYTEARVQAPETAWLTMGVRLAVLETGLGKEGRFARTPQGFVPFCHLRALGDWATDPVSVAEMFLGTPYLWGGNSRAGLDCSGLAQAAFLATGRDFPGDADLQESVGRPLGTDEALQRGDLLFWAGHIALAVDETRLIHANGHTMSVAYEGIEDCIARVLAQNGGPVTRRTRP